MRIPSLNELPKEERDKRNTKCSKCETRKWYARLDFHFDWVDCPYDCPNDIEHLIRGERMSPEEIIKSLEDMRISIEEAIDILSRMSQNHFYGHRETEAMRMGAEALRRSGDNVSPVEVDE